MDPILSRWRLVGVETVLLLLVGGSWIGGWWATRSTLASQPAGSRNVTLAFWSTASYLWVVPVLVGATMVFLVLRYRWPIVAFLLGSAAVLFYGLQFTLIDAAEFGSTIALVILTFWAAIAAARLWPIAVTAISVAAVSTARFYEVQQNLANSGQTRSPLLSSITETAGRVIIVSMALAAGGLVRRLRAQTTELSERNIELDQRRRQAAHAAVSDERLRISRELHDVVAHHISAMTVHAGGAQRALSTNTDAAHTALEQIAKSGRSAIAELQRMLGFLRSADTHDDPARGPAPSLRHLTWLTESFGHDLDVEITTTGDISALPASVDLSAYRIVQEALTNVVKHGASKRAAVDITVEATTTSLRISNDHDRQRNGSSPGTGHGLIGMQERAALHQGSLTTGPADSDTWQVHAVLNHAGVDHP